MEKDNMHLPQNPDTFSLGAGLSISTKSDIKNSISITNNRAQYYSNLAKKFRDEAKIHCDNAKHYAEENSNVTYDQLIDLRNVLETEINTKQEKADYALKEELPVNVSELENDSNYATKEEVNSAVDSVRLPNFENNSKQFLFNDGENLIWKEIPQEKMFGIRWFDKKLSFEESKGYALQGTYVYKVSAPERYGYPDFYNTCLKEYQDSEQVIITDVDINQPVFTSNTEDGITISDSRGNTTVLRALMNGTNTYNQIGLWSTYWLNIDYNEPTVLKNYTIKADSNGSAEYPTAWTVQGTNDGETFEVIDSQSGIAFTLGQSLTFEISEQNTTYRQYRIVFSDGVLSGGSNGELSKVTFEAKRAYNVFKHSNGHFFYDISDKDLIDKYFASNSIAWFYGVDKENERIFLPRNLRYFKNGEIENLGSLQKAGVPNIYGTYASRGIEHNYINVTGAFYDAGTTTYRAAGDSAIGGKIGFDASRISPIFGNSNTVDVDSTNLLVYIVVGTTEQESAITDVTEITTSENDTIPLFTGQYFDFKPNNVSWLKAGEQANSGGIYTSCYNTLVNCLTEVNNIYDLKVITTEDMKDGIDYSEYWKINQDEMYFITPTTLSYKALSGRVKGNGSAMVGVKNLTAPAIEEPEFYFGKHTTSDYVSIWNSAQAQNAIGLTPNASKSGIIAEESDVQLYFKVTNAVQNLELLDVGKVLESLSDKIGHQECVSYVTDAYEDGLSWYRIWSPDHTGKRYYEEGGFIAAGTAAKINISFFFEFAVIPNLSGAAYSSGTGSANVNTVAIADSNLSTTGFAIRRSSVCNKFWNVRGYLKN